jgi:hypothetical protein
MQSPEPKALNKNKSTYLDPNEMTPEPLRKSSKIKMIINIFYQVNKEVVMDQLLKEQEVGNVKY